MKIKFEVELTKDQLLEAFLESIHMNWINDDGDFEIRDDGVYKDGELIDERSNLFAALRNVENSMYPGLEFRSDSYITHYGE